jgi:nitroreductase/NAD-dependent dihydropyrimidine dehydrogenase PreA subunit
MQIEHDYEKCNRCMLCVKDCVSGVMRQQDGLPKALYPNLCNLCSHCVAVCPKDAIFHSGLDMASLVPVEREKLVPEVYDHIVRTRRSMRHFANKPVGRGVLEKMLELARYSPTASNDQNVHFVVVRDRERIREAARRIWKAGETAYGAVNATPGKQAFAAIRSLLPVMRLAKYADAMDFYMEESAMGRDFILHDAPVLILIAVPNRASFGCDNCNIAAANITNYAHAIGLGTCYLGFLTLALRFSKSLRELLQVPEKKRVYASLSLGWPKYRHARATARKPPRITWLD